jgi:PAS domain S-box-containing protein
MTNSTNTAQSSIHAGIGTAERSGEIANRLSAKSRLLFVGGLLLLLVVAQFVYVSLITRPGPVIVALFTGAILGLGYGVYLLLMRDWLKPIRALNTLAFRLTHTHETEPGDDLTQLDLQLHRLSKQLMEATQLAGHIGKGQYAAQLQYLSPKEGLGLAFTEMQGQLQQIAVEEAKRNWTINGINQLEEVLRNHQSSSVADLSYAFIRQVVKYLDANQGGIYLISDLEKKDSYIDLVACYAYEKKKFEERRIERGQGLVGQCILENEPIYLTEVPANYVRITSGLGEATPRNILLVPMRSQDQTFGVIEMASFQSLEAHQIEFVENVSGSFASVIAGVQTNARTQRLLDESRAITTILQEQEEITRQNAEELIATQEELARKIVEIQKESILTNSIVDAINKTNASLELDMDGNVIAVNDMYLSLMEYSREELLGKPEKSLVAADELLGERYDMMWNSIRSGAFNSGEYRRVSKSGRELWLTGTYSPICDIEGKPYKIIQYAQFTTEQKEKELELFSKIQAINQCIPLIEMTTDCVIITANAFFMNTFGFKRSDLRNRKLDCLFDSQFASSNEFVRLCQSLQEGEVMTLPLQFKTNTGEERYFLSNFSHSRNLSGQVNKILLALIDTTEQHCLKEQLQQMLQNEKRKNAILELQAETTDEFVDKLGDIILEIEANSDQKAMDNLLKDKKIPVIELDQKGNILFVNQGLTKILGSEEADLIGIAVTDFMDFPCPEESSLFKSKIRTPALSQMKLRFKIKDTEVITFSVFLTPRFNYSEKNDFFTMLLLMMNVEPNI